jgi:hypothetical protein
VANATPDIEHPVECETAPDQRDVVEVPPVIARLTKIFGRVVFKRSKFVGQRTYPIEVSSLYLASSPTQVCLGEGVVRLKGNRSYHLARYTCRSGSQGRAHLGQKLSARMTRLERLIHVDLDEPYRRIGLKLADQIHVCRDDRADHEIAAA